MVVEGHSDKLFAESKMFENYCGNLGIKIEQIINAGGNGNLCGTGIKDFIDELRENAHIQRVLVLADLDSEACAPCITKRKERIGNEADYIVIAKNAIESWFLADHEFLKTYISDEIDIEHSQRSEQELDPFGKLKSLREQYGSRGLRNKKQFMKRSRENFSLDNAAIHSDSARYLIKTLNAIVET